MLEPSQVDRYHEDGFLVVPGLLDREEVAPIRAAFDATSTLDEVASTNRDFAGNESFRAAFWRDPGGGTLLARLPLMPRLVDAVESLIGRECYYWRSRLVFKKPREAGRIEYHQDFSYWYQDGCVFPDLISCSVAVTPSTRANGCLEFLRGSHRVGRLDLDPHVEGAEYPDPRYIDRVALRHPAMVCEMEPGDALFFHANVVHGSGPNTTDAPRILVHNTYNAADNTPIRLDGQSDLLADSQRYEPIERVPDDLIRAGLYSAVFDRKAFFPAEHGSDNAVGIFKRSQREDADGRTPSAA